MMGSGEGDARCVPCVIALDNADDACDCDEPKEDDPETAPVDPQ